MQIEKRVDGAADLHLREGFNRYFCFIWSITTSEKSMLVTSLERLS